MKKIISVIVLVLLVFFIAYTIVKISNASQYFYTVKNFSENFNIDPLLVFSIINVESNFKEKAVSKKGAIGLMQIMPNTAKEITKTTLQYNNIKMTELSKPDVNIYVGCAYLSNLFMLFNNDIKLVLAAYNAGIGNIQQWYKGNKIENYDENKIVFKETKQYVKKVYRIYKVLSFINKYKKIV